MGEAQWTLDTLAQVARDAGIAVGRSQVRRILLAERSISWPTPTAGTAWRTPRGCPPLLESWW